MHRTCGELRSTGDCGPAVQACRFCFASGSLEIIPNLPATSFDQGGLRCSGLFACGDLVGTWEFQNSSNFLSCTGIGSCGFNFVVENVGAVCCDNEQSCSGAAFALTTDPASNCTQDACCRGGNSCSTGQQLFNVNSLYCTGEQACLQLTAVLSGDLFCDGYSNETCSSFPGGGTSFAFEANHANKHCIQCISNEYGGICKEVLFDFTAAPATTVRMKCEGSDACMDSTILLTAGVTLYIHCDGGSTCSGLIVDASALGISGFGNCCVPLKMRSS